MIEPLHITEQLMYTTARITAPHAGGSVSRGTGFFYRFPIPNDADHYIPALVTNKHVIKGARYTEFVIHTNSNNGRKPDGNVAVEGATHDWVMHPDDKVDLCALPIAGLFESLKPIKPFYKTLAPVNIPTIAQLEECAAVEDLLMIGYPNGLWDSKNNYPLPHRTRRLTLTLTVWRPLSSTWRVFPARPDHLCSFTAQLAMSTEKETPI